MSCVVVSVVSLGAVVVAVVSFVFSAVARRLAATFSRAAFCFSLENVCPSAVKLRMAAHDDRLLAWAVGVQAEDVPPADALVLWAAAGGGSAVEVEEPHADAMEFVEFGAPAQVVVHKPWQEVASRLAEDHPARNWYNAGG